jgi:L-aminopeptidase/D-esterase-like protein
VLSGGSAFGLDSASGVQAALREMGVGFEVRGMRIPIVPTAIVFDLQNGGDKDWGRYPPYRELGYEAARAAAENFAIGTAGGGTGALTSGLKGGLGSASTVLESGVTVGALVVVNATGSVTVGRSRHFWAAPWEIADEFGGLGLPSPLPPDTQKVRLKFRDEPRAGENTTIAVIATDAVMTKADARRLAISAHDGFARAIWPAHTPVDGDLVFALATGRSGKTLRLDEAIDHYAAASATMARAIARAVYTATPRPNDLFPVWSTRSPR